MRILDHKYNQLLPILEGLEIHDIRYLFQMIERDFNFCKFSATLITEEKLDKINSGKS